MDSNLVRKHFVDFFKSKSHQVNSSSSLVVKNDPTLMFVNSGMVPFKEFFLENSTSKIQKNHKLTEMLEGFRQAQ